MKPGAYQKTTTTRQKAVIAVFATAVIATLAAAAPSMASILLGDVEIRDQTSAVRAAFLRAKHLTDLDLPKTRQTELRFVNSKTQTACLGISIHGDTASVSHEGDMLPLLRRSQIGEFLSQYRPTIVECDEVDVTVLIDANGHAGRFSVRYRTEPSRSTNSSTHRSTHRSTSGVGGARASARDTIVVYVRPAEFSSGD